MYFVNIQYRLTLLTIRHCASDDDEAEAVSRAKCVYNLAR